MNLRNSRRKACVVSNLEKQPLVRKAIKVRSPAELPQLHKENCSVPLTVVPCRIRILEEVSIRKFYEETYRIERLFFNGEQNVALSKLRGIDDELVFIHLLESRVYLLEEN